MSEQRPVYLQPDQLLEARVEDLLGRMTVAEKLGQLNMPILRDADALPDGVELPDGWVGAPGSGDAEALVSGEHAPWLGPIGGFFGLEGFNLEGTSEGSSTPASQLARRVALQRRARERTRLGIPLLQLSEGCHGLLAPGATVFPEGPALGSSFDRGLIHDVYRAIGAEARAVGVHLLSTLVIEPIRDPRLGRNCEAYSEDPYQTREIALQIVAGMQGDDVTAPDRAGAILTCFPGQSEPVAGMERGALELSERRLREVFLPAWTAASGADGALALMVTYPAIDGIPAHGNERWMTGVLRDELGFGGLAVSEGFGFETLIYEGIVATQKEAGVLALRAGVDVNITWEDAYLQPLAESLAEGLVSESLLDRAVRRVLACKFRLGLFDEPLEQPAERTAIVHCDEHAELALRAARDGIVLLKNERTLLPLAPGLRRIAVLGPNADDGRNLLGDYVTGDVTQPVETVLEAIRAAAGDGTEVVHERGCDVVDRDDADLVAAAAAAAGADVAVVVVGERSGWFFDDDGRWWPTVGERSDVQSLELSGRQDELVRAVQATGTPTVVVLVNGRALSVAWAAANVDAIVEAWLPGERGGRAIADVLFGVVDPGGRLPVTIPAHVGQLPVYYNHLPSKHYWHGFGGYVDAADDGRPLYPFGFGLSYTTFAYDDLEIAPAGAAGVAAEVSLTVRNSGERDGSEVVQLYVRDRHSSVATPVRQLRGFEKVALAAGERATVRFTLTHADLALLDADMRLVVEPGVFDVMVGASSEDVRLSGELHVEREVELPGAVPLTPAPAPARR